MQTLIPEIEIGKKYLWRSSPIELLCDTCGANRGNGRGDFAIECTVIETGNTRSRCKSCGAIHELMEGWHWVKAVEGEEVGYVPYTQLEEIKEEEENGSIISISRE